MTGHFPRLTLSLLILFALAAPSASQAGQAASASVPTVKDIKTEILALPSARTASSDNPAIGAWDNEPLMAVFYNPATGENIYGPAIVFVDNGPGSHPMPLTSASRFAAERLAAKGYSVLSLFSRISRGYGNIPFESSALDIKAAIDFLEARGHEDVILAGHGFGSAMVAYYVASQKDEALDAPGKKRVKATVHFAPMRDDLAAESGLGKDYAAKVKFAQDEVAKAKASPAPARVQGVPPAPRPNIVVRPGMAQSPSLFLNYWGPDANTPPSNNFPKIDSPILLLVAANDPTVLKGSLEALRAKATSSPRVDLISYPTGNHAFDGLWDKSADDVAAWLTSQGLGVRPKVNVEIIDARAENGEMMAAVLYVPEGGIPADKPAFLLQFGTSGDALHSATQWLGWRLAQAGHSVLSPRSRMSGTVGLEVSNYAEQVSDLGQWMDMLESRGIKRVIIEGHSLGGVLISNYAARTHDPRVIGLVYMAPTRDSPLYVRSSLGPDKETQEAVYARVSKEADDAVARGEGDTHMVYYGGSASFASHWVDKRGPKAPIHTTVIKDIKVPSLVFAGTRDGLMTKEFVEQFTSSYGGQSEAIWVQDGYHNGRESKEFYRDQILAWVKRAGLDGSAK